MTYSVVARDPDTGALGVAMQSKVLAAGSSVCWAKAGVGAVATQALVNRAYGPGGLRLLETGLSPQEGVAELTSADSERHHRQLGVVDARGRAFSWTGDDCIPWAGGRQAQDVAAQANLCAGPRVVDAMVETFEARGRPFADLLIGCLASAEAAGGDRRGRQAAALLIVGGATDGFGSEEYHLDLRVDDHSSPIDELARLLALDRLIRERPQPESLRPVDESLAAELRHLLQSVGTAPGQPTFREVPEVTDPAVLAAVGVEIVGEPRELAAGWDAEWQRALEAWMGVENLSGRLAAPGWIDPRVLDFLRAQGGE